MPNFHLPNFMICPPFDERFSHQLCRKCLRRETPRTDPISDGRVWAPCPACWVEAPSPAPSSARPSKGSLKTRCPQLPAAMEAELDPDCGWKMREEELDGPGLAGQGSGVQGQGPEAWVFISALDSLCDLGHIAFRL